jgi:hypothetical protein
VNSVPKKDNANIFTLAEGIKDQQKQIKRGRTLTKYLTQKKKNPNIAVG